MPKDQDEGKAELVMKAVTILGVAALGVVGVVCGIMAWRGVDAAILYHRTVPHPAVVPVGERKGLDEAVFGIEDRHAPVARIRDRETLVGARRPEAVHEFAGSLPLPAMSRDVGAVAVEYVQFLCLGIEDDEASTLQHHEALQIGECVRAGTIHGADAGSSSTSVHGDALKRQPPTSPEGEKSGSANSFGRAPCGVPCEEK